MKLIFATLFAAASFWGGVCYEHAAMQPKLEAAERAVAAWKAKDAQNYPLARQWRIAYEQLKSKCEATK